MTTARLRPSAARLDESYTGDGNIAGVLSIDAMGWILIIAGLLAIILSFAMRGRRAGYSTVRESTVDPATGSRVDRTDVDPR